METLAPSILQVRNSFLEQFQNEKLENISKKLDQLFDVEKDPVKRIVLLASRVETIRKRIELRAKAMPRPLLGEETNSKKSEVPDKTKSICMGIFLNARLRE